MSDRRWPSFGDIEAMESTEAYDLYYHLPAPADAEQLAIIRALGDKGWQMRQEEDAGKVKRTFLPMPERSPAPAAQAAPAARPKFKAKARPSAAPASTGGASFFLAGLKA